MDLGSRLSAVYVSWTESVVTPLGIPSAGLTKRHRWLWREAAGCCCASRWEGWEASMGDSHYRAPLSFPKTDSVRGHWAGLEPGSPGCFLWLDWSGLPCCLPHRCVCIATSLRVLFLTVIAPTRGLFSSAFSVFTAHSCDSWRCRRLEKTLLSYSLPFSKHVPRSVPFWLICLVYPTLSIFLFLSFPLKQLLTWPVLLEGSLSRPSTFSLLFCCCIFSLIMFL